MVPPISSSRCWVRAGSMHVLLSVRIRCQEMSQWRLTGFLKSGREYQVGCQPASPLFNWYCEIKALHTKLDYDVDSKASDFILTYEVRNDPHVQPYPPHAYVCRRFLGAAVE